MACANCGSAYEEGDRFCAVCGTPTAGQVPSTQTPGDVTIVASPLPSTLEAPGGDETVVATSLPSTQAAAPRGDETIVAAPLPPTPVTPTPDETIVPPGPTLDSAPRPVAAEAPSSPPATPEHAATPASASDPFRRDAPAQAVDPFRRDEAPVTTAPEAQPLVDDAKARKLEAAVAECGRLLDEFAGGAIDETALRRGLLKAGLVAGEDDVWLLDIENERWCRFDGMELQLLPISETGEVGQ